MSREVPTGATAFVVQGNHRQDPHGDSAFGGNYEPLEESLILSWVARPNDGKPFRRLCIWGGGEGVGGGAVDFLADHLSALRASLAEAH